MLLGSLRARDSWSVSFSFFQSLKGGDRKSYLLPRAAVRVQGHDLGNVFRLVPGMQQVLTCNGWYCDKASHYRSVNDWVPVVTVTSNIY